MVFFVKVFSLNSVANCGTWHIFCNTLIDKIRSVRYRLCLVLLYFGMLAYRTYILVVEHCLTAESRGVALAMNVLEDMYLLEVDVCCSNVVLQHRSFYLLLL
jgi:hypothetical protein